MTLINLPNEPIVAVPTPRLHPYHLGASLYMPATRMDIYQVIQRKKISDIHSIIICLEDAVHDDDVDTALSNVARLLDEWHATPSPDRPLVFIRPRHHDMLHTLSDMAHIDLVDGFVLPKVDMISLADWRYACQSMPDDKFIMPTLETAPIFGATHNDELVVALKEGFGRQILAIRVGGNDLLSCLRMRRSPEGTLYESPLGTLMHRLLGVFVPQGFYLTSPVFEYLDKPHLLSAELAIDVSLGLVGKTVIHPTQIPIVTHAFKVSPKDHAQACAILDTHAKAVFKQDNTMLEPATHTNWAKHIMARHEVFGLSD